MSELLIEPKSFLEAAPGPPTQNQCSGGLIKVQMSEAHPDLQNQSLWGWGSGNLCFRDNPQVIPAPASQNLRSTS